MPKYYMPKTKKDLTEWIRRQYWVRGQTCCGLDKKPIKKLQAIYYSIIEKHEEGRNLCAMTITGGL